MNRATTWMLLAAMSAAALASGCKKTEEPIAARTETAPSTNAATAPADAGFQVLPHQGKLVKDDAGHYIPTTPPPPIDSSKLPPKPMHEPTADLDPDDPARDYVIHYVRGTHRYGDRGDCVVVGKSTPSDPPKRVVEVKDDKNDPKCGGSDTLRDAFVVDVGGDRMWKKDANVGDPLKPWPDGSDPDAPPNKTIIVDDVLKAWKNPLHDAIHQLRLTVIGVDLVLRGTYPIVTLAGFRDPFNKDGNPAAMTDAAAKLCAANKNEWFSFFGGLDRANALRIRCNPPSVRWDRF